MATIVDKNYIYHKIGDEYAVFMISDLDESSTPKYYGMLTESGAWMIMKLTDTTARYAMGKSDYTTNWANRASLTYSYYNQLV